MVQLNTLSLFFFHFLNFGLSLLFFFYILLFLLNNLFFVDVHLPFSRFIIFFMELDYFVACRFDIFSIFYFLRYMEVFGPLQIFPDLLQIHHFSFMVSFSLLPHLRQELHLSVVFIGLLLILLLLNLQQREPSLHFVDIIFCLFEMLEALVAFIDVVFLLLWVLGWRVGRIV